MCSAYGRRLHRTCSATKIAQDLFCNWPVKNWKQVSLQPQNRHARAILLQASTLLRSTATVQTLRCQAALPPPCDATTALLHYAAADNARCLRCAAAPCPPLRCRHCATIALPLPMHCAVELRCAALRRQHSAPPLRCSCQPIALPTPRCRCQRHTAVANLRCSSVPLTCKDTTALQCCAAAANALQCRRYSAAANALCCR